MKAQYRTKRCATNPALGQPKEGGASCHQKNGSAVTKKTVAVTKMELVVTNTKNGVF